MPLIQSYITEETIGYIEPFVGGANIIDKIKCDNKIGYDIHKQLIELLKHIQNTVEDLPDTITEEEYKKVKNNKEKYEDWYVGLVGFCASFGSKYFGGYARSKRTKDMSRMGMNNLLKQAPNLEGIKFSCKDFREIKDIKGYVIYCDPPYKNTIKYNKRGFPYEEFYVWCREMSKHNTVLISEYDMPTDFECIWEKGIKVSFNSYRGRDNPKDNRVEKLFICR